MEATKKPKKKRVNDSWEEEGKFITITPPTKKKADPK